MSKVTFNKKEKKNLMLYLFSRGFLAFGDSIYSFAISFFILYQTGSALASSINLVVYTLVNLICLPFAGYLADKFNKKPIIVLGELIDPIVIFGLFIYMINYGFDLTAIYIVTGITTLTSAFVGNAFQSAMTEIFNTMHIQKVMGYQQSIISLSTILAPATAGALIGLFPLEVILMIFVVLGFLAVLIDFVIDFNLHYDATLYEDKETKKFLEDVSLGAKYLFKSNIYRPIAIFGFSVNFFGAMISIYPQKALIVEMGLSSQIVGLIFAFSSVGTIIASIFIAKIKHWRNPVGVTRLCTIILAILLSLFAIPLYLPVTMSIKLIMMGTLFVANAIALTFLNTPMMVFYQMTVPQNIKGRVFSMLTVVSISVMPLGAIMYGYLLDLELYLPVTILAGVAIVIVTLSTLNRSLIAKSKEIMDEILKVEDTVDVKIEPLIVE